MLEIHQKDNISYYTNYLSQLGISSENVQIVEAVDKNTVLGFSIFSYINDTVILYYVDYNDDKYLCDGIIRTVLFKASMLGIDKAEFKMKDLTLMKTLGFLKNESNCLSSIQSIMDNCKNCKKSC